MWQTGRSLDFTAETCWVTDTSHWSDRKIINWGGLKGRSSCRSVCEEGKKKEMWVWTPSDINMISRSDRFSSHICLFTATLTKRLRWNCNLHGRGHYNYYNHQWIFNPPVKQERTRVQREKVGFKISLIWTSASRTLLEGLLVSLFIHWSKVRRRRSFSLVDKHSLDCYVDFT